MPAHMPHDRIAATDSRLPEPFDTLVYNASLGDRRAIAALAIGLGPALLEEARDALGERRAAEDEDLLQDLFVCLTQGKLTFIRGRDDAREWLRAQLRSLAQDSPTDRLLARALDADPDAVEQVMTELEDMLVGTARAALGTRLVDEAEAVVEQLEEEMLEGALSCKCKKGRRAAIGFLKQRIGAMAREKRREAEGREASRTALEWEE